MLLKCHSSKIIIIFQINIMMKIRLALTFFVCLLASPNALALNIYSHFDKYLAKINKPLKYYYCGGYDGDGDFFKEKKDQSVVDCALIKYKSGQSFYSRLHLNSTDEIEALGLQFDGGNNKLVLYYYRFIRHPKKSEHLIIRIPCLKFTLADPKKEHLDISCAPADSRQDELVKRIFFN